MSEVRFDCQGLGLVARNEDSILVFDTKPVLYRPVLDQIQFCSFDRGCKTCLDTKPVLDQGRFCSLTHGHHKISNDRAAVKGVACQPSAASMVDRRAAGDLRYRLGLDHLGLCKPAMRSWNQSGDWQGASVVRPVLVWYGWIYAVWGPPEQHSSEFTKYDSIVYLGCHTTGCCNSRFWTSHRLR